MNFRTPNAVKAVSARREENNSLKINATGGKLRSRLRNFPPFFGFCKVFIKIKRKNRSYYIDKIQLKV